MFYSKVQSEKSELLEAFCSKRSLGREDEYAWNSKKGRLIACADNSLITCKAEKEYFY